jgi:hypothetical protein
LVKEVANIWWVIMSNGAVMVKGLSSVVVYQVGRMSSWAVAFPASTHAKAH